MSTNLPGLRLRSAVLLFCVMVLLGASECILGQNLGSITGLVTDKTGAAVPNATVKLTNTETGLARTFITNESGNYVAPAMPAGTYNLEVTASGFAVFRQTAITLNLRDALRIDAVLDVSSVQEAVEVKAEAIQVQSENATVGEVVNGTQVVALSMNGRNFTSLAALVPGASSTQPSLNTPVGVTSNTSIAFNGLRTSQNVWRMDGQEDYDRGCGGCIAVLPSMEAIAEFKVETANASVDTGFGSAGQMNVSTKSGTRDFHGTAYEYVRNDKMDAANFFTNLNGQPKPPLRFNVFGYNLGGPFFIPKIYPREKSKTFFFFNEEWRKLRQSSIFNSQTPTLQERTGDFSDYPKPIIDPNTGSQFPGNKIPSSRLDPNAVILAKPDFIFPLPTNPNGFYTRSFSVPTDLREEIVRVDHNFSDREQVFFRFIEETNHQNFTNNLWSGNTFPTTTTLLVNNPKLYLGQLTSTISPRTVNELSASYTYQPLDLFLNGNYQRPAGLDIPELFPENRQNRIPNISLSGGYSVNYDLASWPWSNAAEITIVRDNLTLTRGAHTIAIGGLLMNFHKQQDLFGQTNGNFSFNGSYTGFGFADFMLGKAFQYTELQNQYEPNYITHSATLYVSDNWKASSKLTITGGLAWNAFPHAFEEQDRVASFYQNLWDPAKAVSLDNNGRIIPGSGDRFNGLGSAGKNGIPRGLVENHWMLFQPRVGLAWRPFGDDTVFRAGYGLYYERIQGNDIYNVAPNPPFVSTATIFNTSLSNPGGGGAAIPVSNLTVYDPNYPVPQVQQWNAGVQRKLASGVVMNLAYVGTKGTYLSDTRNINQPFPAQAEAFRNKLIANVNQARPYPGYGNINMYFNGTNSSYNSFQASLRSQQYHGLTLQASYTWSHSLDYASGDVPGNAHQDAYNWKLEHASSNFDRTHMLILSYVYDIPFLTGRGLLSQVFGNWQLSGISAFETGTPLNISLPGDNAFIGGAPYRPDLVHDPNNHGGRTAWFDPTAFAQPAPGMFGNASRNVVRAAGLNNTDASLFKNFPGILKREGSSLQFRAEFYNLFNHTQWSSFRTTFGASDFGAAVAARDARDIQLGLRLYF